MLYVHRWMHDYTTSNSKPAHAALARFTVAETCTIYRHLDQRHLMSRTAMPGVEKMCFCQYLVFGLLFPLWLLKQFLLQMVPAVPHMTNVSGHVHDVNYRSRFIISILICACMFLLGILPLLGMVVHLNWPNVHRQNENGTFRENSHHIVTRSTIGFFLRY